MDFRGIFENGHIRPTEPTPLPDGTVVEFHALSHDDDAAHESLRSSDAQARANKSIEEIAEAQGVKPLRSGDDLRGDWPDDDSIDDFLAWLRQSRAA